MPTKKPAAVFDDDDDVSNFSQAETAGNVVWLELATDVKYLLSVLLEWTRGDATRGKDEDEEHWKVCLFSCLSHLDMHLH